MGSHKPFFSFERPEIASFRAAVEQFKQDLPLLNLTVFCQSKCQ